MLDSASLIRSCLLWHLHVTRTCLSAAVWRIVILRWLDGGFYSFKHYRTNPGFLNACFFVCLFCLCAHIRKGHCVTDASPAVFNAIQGLKLHCIYLLLRWLPKISLLVLTSMKSNCQLEKKSFPPPLVLISQETLTFSSTEMWSIS